MHQKHAGSSIPEYSSRISASCSKTQLEEGTAGYLQVAFRKEPSGGEPGVVCPIKSSQMFIVAVYIGATVIFYRSAAYPVHKVRFRRVLTHGSDVETHDNTLFLPISCFNSLIDLMISLPSSIFSLLASDSDSLDVVTWCISFESVETI
jgi:hypothetical protein